MEKNMELIKKLSSLTIMSTLLRNYQLQVIKPRSPNLGHQITFSFSLTKLKICSLRSISQDHIHIAKDADAEPFSSCCAFLWSQIIMSCASISWIVVSKISISFPFSWITLSNNPIDIHQETIDEGAGPLAQRHQASSQGQQFWEMVLRLHPWLHGNHRSCLAKRRGPISHINVAIDL